MAMMTTMTIIVKRMVVPTIRTIHVPGETKNVEQPGQDPLLQCKTSVSWIAQKEKNAQERYMASSPSTSPEQVIQDVSTPMNRALDRIRMAASRLKYLVLQNCHQFPLHTLQNSKDSSSRSRPSFSGPSLTLRPVAKVLVAHNR